MSVVQEGMGRRGGRTAALFFRPGQLWRRQSGQNQNLWRKKTLPALSDSAPIQDSLSRWELRDYLRTFGIKK